MSISSQNRKAGPYTGNGTTTNFPFAFKVFAAGDVRVVRTTPESLENDLVLGTDYTVSLNADQNATPGGTIVATLPTDHLLTITSKVENLQPVTLTNQGAFYPSVINDALDRQTILVQQVAEQVSRSIKVDISSTLQPQQLLTTLNENAIAAVASSASALEAQSAAAVSATSAAASANSIIGSVDTAAAHATSAGNSATLASNSATLASNSATSASVSASGAVGSALQAVNAAATVVAPVAITVASYLDSFIPVGQLMGFAAMYVVGGWDMGGLTVGAPFSNEAVTARRASLSAGDGTFDFGTL